MKSNEQKSDDRRRHCAMSLSMFLFFFLVLLSVFLPWCIPGSRLHSITWEIKQDGTGDFTTIQAGIDASADSDTVLVYPGTYFENLDFNGHNITLASLELTTGDEQYISTTIIDGQNQESCIRIHNGENEARVQGFTVQNGYGTLFWSEDGGGFLVHDNSTAFITNCVIKDNIATLGAGIYAREAYLHLSGLRIIQNSAVLGGALYIADDSTIDFDTENRCNIYNNNAGKGADLLIRNTGQIDVIIDTFSVFNPSRYFAEYSDGSTYSFDIQHNWMELEPNDLYVAVDGDDSNSGLTPEEPLKNISWAVRKIQADEQNPRTVHVESGVYSYQTNQQIFPVGCKEYVSIIGEDMGNTILINDYNTNAIFGKYLIGFVEMSNFSIRNDPAIYTTTVMYFREVEKLILNSISIQNNANINKVFSSEHVYNEFSDLIILDNTSDGIHPGIALLDNAGFMKNCIVSNNTSSLQPPFECVAAMQLEVDDDFLIENCIFSDNHSTNSESRIIRLFNQYIGEPVITFNNCLISDNSIGSRYVFQNFNFDGLTEFNNCTFANNTATSSFYPTTLYSYGDINMTNTIMHNNTDYEIFMVDDTAYNYIYELNVDHCNIKDGEAGVYNQNGVNIVNWLEGNIDEDPLFAGIGDHPYQLTGASPCIDAGVQDTIGLYLPPWDLLGNYRIWDGDNNGSEIIDMGCYEFDADEYPVGITNDEIPFTNYKLANYPNPFNPETRIVFEIPQAGNIKLEIFNIKGQKVKTLIDCYMSQGGGETIWNGRDEKGKRVSSGVYLFQLSTPAKIITKKCMLMK